MLQNETVALDNTGLLDYRNTAKVYGLVDLISFTLNLDGRLSQGVTLLETVTMLRLEVLD
jgi:hypothetical protein